MASVTLNPVWRADIEHQMAEWVEHDACGGTGLPDAKYILDGRCLGCVNGRTPAPLYIIGEGRNCYWPDYQAGGDCVTCGHVQEDHPFPPAGWPSLNATTPCETCVGVGTILTIDPPPKGAWERPCRDCNGSGSSPGVRVELRVPCPTCGGIKTIPDAGVTGYWGERPCPQSYGCDATGSVRFAVVTWQTLPVLGWASPMSETNPDFNALSYPCVMVIGTNAVLVPSKDWVLPDAGADLLPLAAGSVRPGNWVAELTGIELA